MIKKLLPNLTILLIIFMLSSCSKTENKKELEKEIQREIPKPAVTEKNESLVKYIESNEHFEEVMEKSDSLLLVFDLYADWCNPCKILSPILEEVAQETQGKAEIYKINTEKHRDLARAFGVKSIPLVVFVKNKKGVDGLVGVQPKKSYINTINKHSFK